MRALRLVVIGTDPGGQVKGQVGVERGREVLRGDDGDEESRAFPPKREEAHLEPLRAQEGGVADGTPDESSEGVGLGEGVQPPPVRTALDHDPCSGSIAALAATASANSLEPASEAGGWAASDMRVS